MNKKKMRKLLIKYQNRLGKNEGKNLWLLKKKEMHSASLS